MPTAQPGRPDRSRGSARRPDGVGDDATDDTVLDDTAPDDTAPGGADLDGTAAADAEDLDAADDADDAEGTVDADEADDAADLDTVDGDAPGDTLTRTRRRAGATTSLTKTRPATRPERGRTQPRRSGTRTGNPFVALARFVREVVGEMRKVLWPTRRELIVYTIAVILFVTIMISIVGGLDFGFARLILFVFG